MNIAKRHITIILSIVFICLVLLASCLVITENRHDCLGENCTICCVVERAKAVLYAFVVLSIFSLLLPVLSKTGSNHLLLSLKHRLLSTLILLKVKLSN